MQGRSSWICLVLVLLVLLAAGVALGMGWGNTPGNTNPWQQPAYGLRMYLVHGAGPLPPALRGGRQR